MSDPSETTPLSCSRAAFLCGAVGPTDWLRQHFDDYLQDIDTTFEPEDIACLPEHARYGVVRSTDGGTVLLLHRAAPSDRDEGEETGSQPASVGSRSDWDGRDEGEETGSQPDSVGSRSDWDGRDEGEETGSQPDSVGGADRNWVVVGYYNTPGAVCLREDHQGLGLGAELILWTALHHAGGPPTAGLDEQCFTAAGFAAHQAAWRLGVQRGLIVDPESTPSEAPPIRRRRP